MSLFGRKKKQDQSTTEGKETPVGTDTTDSSNTPVLPGDADPAERSKKGPWDVTESGQPEIPRLDLGALQVPAVEGLEVKLEVEQETEVVNAVNLMLNGSNVQIQVFAAPRTEGIWDEIREELLAQVQRSGGTADDVPGHFGREVIARIPTRTPSGRTSHQVARFCGVDGPRWFVRAVFNGPAAHDETAAQELEHIVRGLVVVRGDDARPPRELLGLTIPDAPRGQAAETEEDDAMEAPRRGPEIQQIG